MAWYCKQQRLPRITYPVEIFIIFYEPNRRRDVDNVYSAQKYILDGLVRAGVLQGDGQRWVRDVIPRIEIDAARPRVQVRLESTLLERLG